MPEAETEDRIRKTLTFESEAPEPEPTPEPAGLRPEQQLSDADLEWTTEELEEAFVRIANGESVKMVADEYNKNWRSLRGRWGALTLSRMKAAQEKGRELVPVPPKMIGKVSITPGAVIEPERCTMCDKEFVPARADTSGLCARCRHDA